MREKSTAVLVSGEGSNLQALLDVRARGLMPHARIALVVSSRPGVYALERAKAAGVPSAVLTWKAGGGAAFDGALLALLRERGIEAAALAGFLPILGERVIEAYRGRIINIHPSLLPAFGGTGCYGIQVHRRALEAGVKVTGATVHLVDGTVDGGTILLQKAVEVHAGDTPETLQTRVMKEAEWTLLPRALEQLCAALP
jgi:phosphoribosylglycinamide formyltransferase-1